MGLINTLQYGEAFIDPCTESSTSTEWDHMMEKTYTVTLFLFRHSVIRYSLFSLIR